jgi:monoamine oxidase
MQSARIAIVGGGLSGLCAAYLLEKNGIKDYVLLEARGSFGGRILSLPQATEGDMAVGVPAGGLDRYDLGATWFWPDLQPELSAFIKEMGLEAFPQHEHGDLVVERSLEQAPFRTGGYMSSPQGLRLKGGMGALIDAVKNCLSSNAITSGRCVTTLHQSEDGIDIEATDSLGRVHLYRVAHVLTAVPPRLTVDSMDFSPPLPDDLFRQWRTSATWMAPNAKYLATYEKPFWRDQGLSGEARSTVGPLVEIHDASSQAGGALFGFFGLPAQWRRKYTEQDLIELCRAQLVRLFGREAATPTSEFVKDWAKDVYTATAADQYPATNHASGAPMGPSSGAWQGKIFGIASECSPEFPGYVAGALDAAQRGVEVLLSSESWSAVKRDTASSEVQ